MALNAMATTKCRVMSAECPVSVEGFMASVLRTLFFLLQSGTQWKYFFFPCTRFHANRGGTPQCESYLYSKKGSPRIGIQSKVFSSPAAPRRHNKARRAKRIAPHTGLWTEL